MMETTTQQRIEMLQGEINVRMARIAYYINKGLGECALIELESLSKYQNLQHKAMLKITSEKLFN